MSIGNLKDNSNKGNNFPYQLAVLQLLDQINNSISALPGVDYETRTTTYQAIAGGVGYSIGDIIVRYDIIDVATSTVTATLWFNQTLQTIIPPPAPITLTPYLPPGNVTVTNPFNLEATQLLVLAELAAINAGIPIALGQTTMASSMPVVIASNQSNLRVISNDIVSIGNSSTTPLGASATFIGAWESVLNNSCIVVNVDSNLQGSVMLDQSQDGGVTTSSTATRTFTSVSSGQSYVFTVLTGSVYRVRFTNTVAAGQAFFRLQTTPHLIPVSPPIFAANTPITPSSLTTSAIAIPTDGVKTTYTASILGLVTAASPTDIFTITGSATKTIRVISIFQSGTRSGGGQSDLVIIKRSTANTGGTSSTLTNVPLDSANIASTAVVRAYTANPTLGTTVGAILARKIFISSTGVNVDGGFTQIEFGRLGQACVLRGTGEVLALNFNGVTIAGSSINITITWTEE